MRDSGGVDLHTHVVEFEGEEPTRAHVLGAGYVNEWERYAVARERLKDMRLADGLLENLGWMPREQALPLMEEILAGGRDAVQRLNAARGWIERA